MERIWDSHSKGTVDMESLQAILSGFNMLYDVSTDCNDFRRCSHISQGWKEIQCFDLSLEQKQWTSMAVGETEQLLAAENPSFQDSQKA